MTNMGGLRGVAEDAGDERAPPDQSQGQGQDSNAEQEDLFEDAVDTDPVNEDGEIEGSYRKMAADARQWNLAEELKRNTEITPDHAEGLRAWCREKNVLPDIPDWLLIAFLHCCHSNLDQAKTVMQVYESVRARTPEVFQDRSYFSDEVQRAKSLGYVILLPKKTPEGFRVIVQALRNPDPSLFVYASSSKAQFLTMDAAVRAEPVAEGYVCLFDMQGVQMSHMWAWGIRLPRKIFKYLQEGLPLRMQRIHFLNTTPLMDRVMRMLRPFIHKELASVFRFHTTNDMEDLHEFIPRDCLPENYGGYLPSLEKLQGLTDMFLADVDGLLQ